MKREPYKNLAKFIFASTLVFLSVGIANAQIQSAGGGWYVAGYGNVYGSFGQASVAQGRMYDQMKVQARKKAERDALTNRSGQAAARSTGSGVVVPLPPVVRNHGVFRPDTTVDTGKALADALGGSPAEKTLIKQIYSATQTAYEKEAAARGWKNNIAGGLTFFTVAAMTAYHDGGDPTDEAVNNYFQAVNLSLDEIPEFANATNKDKQGFNNMLIGFGGLLLAGYTEGKQQNDPATLANYKQLAGMLMKLVLKTDPENVRIENGQIVMK